MKLTPEELKRYSRHLNLPNFGMEAQEKLKESKVLIVGTGGLGAPLLLYLTAAGVGTIGIVDFDTVDESNLQRQVLFSTEDIGKNKTSVAVEKLKALNPNITFKVYNEKLTSENALSIIDDFDVVADGTDNFPTRYLVNDACVLLNKPNIYGSIFQYEGQVSVFNYFDGKEWGPNYRDLYPEPPPPGLVPSCAEGGVLGVLPGIIGSMQASETIKVLLGIGSPLSGKLFVYDTLDFSTRKLNIRKNPENPLTGTHPTQTELIDYEEFCGLKDANQKVKSISPYELKNWIDTDYNLFVVDVREEYEFENGSISDNLISVYEIEDNISKIPKEGKVVFYCRSGVRSAGVINLLQNNYNYGNLYNLEGGILAWRNTIDPKLIVI